MSDHASAAVELPIRRLTRDDLPQLLWIINAAAEAYRGKIPEDCWHEPYMPEDELRQELAAGVSFLGIDVNHELAAALGVQRVLNAALIRHAYVAPEWQARGFGGRLLEHVCSTIGGQVLVGTWRAAEWAIQFYEKHGFSLAPHECTPALLRTYWRISESQLRASVVLARPGLDAREVAILSDPAHEQ